MRALMKTEFCPFYSELKKEILSIDPDSLSGQRSSKDLPEQNITTTYLKLFNECYTNSELFWKNMFRQLTNKKLEGFFRSKFIEPPNGLFQTDEEFFYGRMDVGFGFKGYGVVNGGKGNHIDNVNRVISCLLYFTDQSELKGGEFEMTDSEGNIVQRLNVRENMLVASVQDKNGWHRVNPLEEGKRIAIYFALSYTKPYWPR